MSLRSGTVVQTLKLVARCAILVGLCTNAAAIDVTAELALIAGGEGGTYYNVVQDLKKLASAGGINLTVYTSNGSMDNVVAVIQKPTIHLGIVQSDVLSLVNDVSARTPLRQLGNNSLRVVFPLHTEEVHVIGRRGLRDFVDLNDRRVAIGPEGSGMHLTARNLFNLAAVRPREILSVGIVEALNQLRTGRVDALVYVAGSPIALLRERIAAADGLVLLPVSDQRVLEAYDMVEIPGGTYPWQATPVKTVLVKAVLVTSHRDGGNCETIARFAQQIVNGMPWLRQHGHPKWNTVDLNYRLKGWEQYDCVSSYLARSRNDASMPAASPDDHNPIFEAIRDFLGRD